MTALTQPQLSPVAGNPGTAAAVRLEGVAFVLILFSIIPVWLAQRISGAETAGGRL